MNKLIILSVDDWQVLYVNGEEEYQHHEVQIGHISKFCPIESIEEIWITGKLGEYVIDNGGFPNSLEKCIEIGYEVQ